MEANQSPHPQSISRNRLHSNLEIKMEDKIKYLEATRSRLKSEIKQIDAEILKIKIGKVKQGFGIEIGSIVKSNGAEYKITKIDPNWATPFISGVKRNKDGKFGKAERNLYGHWEPVLSGACTPDPG